MAETRANAAPSSSSVKAVKKRTRSQADDDEEQSVEAKRARIEVGLTIINKALARRRAFVRRMDTYDSRQEKFHDLFENDCKSIERARASLLDVINEARVAVKMAATLLEKIREFTDMGDAFAEEGADLARLSGVESIRDWANDDEVAIIDKMDEDAFVAAFEAATKMS